MALAEEIKIIDFVSAIENLHQQFFYLSIDAHHEDIYGTGATLLMVECTELGNRYDAATEACEDLFETKNWTYTMVKKLKIRKSKVSYTRSNYIYEEEDSFDEVEDFNIDKHYKEKKICPVKEETGNNNEAGY